MTDFESMFTWRQPSGKQQGDISRINHQAQRYAEKIEAVRDAPPDSPNHKRTVDSCLISQRTLITMIEEVAPEGPVRHAAVVALIKGFLRLDLMEVRIGVLLAREAIVWGI